MPTVVTAAVLSAAGCAGLAGVHDAPRQATTVAPLAPEQAQTITSRVLAEAASAASVAPADAEAVRKRALTGSALAVAEAAAKLGTGSEQTQAPLTKSVPPRVLAVSRGTGWPRVILAQTTAADGSARLNLLTSPDPQTPFRLSSVARMHPGATVPALDPLPQGAPLLTGNTALPQSPDALAREYAASLAYPRPVAAKHVQTTDPFSVAVRANALAQARSFGRLATLTQRHVVQPKDTVAVGLRGGGAIVFTLLERVDSIVLKPGGKALTPSADFQRLVRKKSLARSAQLKTYETVVFTVPPHGPASVVAVDEVLFSAKGA